MKLTFQDGAFKLVTETSIKSLPFREAVRYQSLADKTAKKVFDRVLVKRFTAPAEPLPDFLDEHQKEGVKWILTRSRSYLAHAPGAGKTVQAIVSSLLMKSKQTLFIVPPSLTLNWEREILKWTAWLSLWPSIYVVGRTKDQENSDWGAEFIVVPDSMLSKPWVHKRLERLHFGLLAVDEASRFKEVTSQRTQALFGGSGFHGLLANARHSVLLDGSPMPNRPMELWAQVYGSAPEVIDFKSAHDFGVRYCNARFLAEGYKLDWDYSGASHQEELNSKLVKSFMHVVTEEKLNHPERLRSMVFANLEGKSVQALRSWEQKHLLNFKLNDVDENKSLGQIAEHRKNLGLSKVPWVINYVRERLENKNESILVFAWHRDVCRKLYAGLERFKPVLVFGDTAKDERESSFARFQAGTCSLIIGNLATMGRGHNLQRASRVVFAEYSWTDETNRQAEKRASRKGSVEKLVKCDYIVVPDSLDEVILNAVFTKAKNVKRVIG